MKKRNMTQRLLACLLGIVLTVLTCACASVDAPKGESTDAETSALDVLENEAESSSGTEPSDEEPSDAEPSEEEPSDAEPSDSNEHISADDDASLSEDVTITPIEPIISEERETTLELVLSFDIGIDGLFQYRMLYYDDPSIADIEIPGQILIGGDGKFYHMVANSPMQGVVSLHDGTALGLSTAYELGRVWVYEDRLYTKMGGILYEYDIANGLESATLVSERECDGKSIYQTAGGKLYLYAKGQFYTMEGEPIAENLQKYVYSDQTLADGALVASSDTARWVIDSEKAAVVAATDETILVREKNLVSPKNAIVHVYTWYDQSGNVKSRMGYKRVYHKGKLPCEVDFDLRGAFGTVKEYIPIDVCIGKTVFENVLWEKMIFDSYGTPYLAVYYLDHCEIYRVNPGYTSADLTNKEASGS